MGDSKSANNRDTSGKVGGKMPKGHSKGKVTMRDFERGKQIKDLTENRLKSDLNDLDSQEMSSMLSIRRDQRMLKEKLFNVQKSSGHYKRDKRSNTFGDLTQTKGTKHSNKMFDKSADLSYVSTGGDLMRLPSLGVKQAANDIVSKDNSTFNTNIQIGTLDDSKLEAPKSLPKAILESRKSQPMDSLNLPVTRKRSKSEQNLNAAWYSNLDEVRSVINQRLSTSMNNLDGKKGDEEKDLEPFMFAVPDGLPRTMYMLPSLDERFHQATKARYIRKPGTKLDPIERELNLNEIFNKNGDGNSDRS
eukprot:gene11027-19872_t